MSETKILPRDYDDYYGVEGLNAEIENLLSQVIVAKNAEIAELIENYTERLQVAETAASELKARNEELEGAAGVQAELVEKMRGMYHDAVEARRDAEFKRDNAVRMAEEAQAALEAEKAENERLRRSVESLKGDINELESMVRTLKSSKPTSGIQLTSTLPTLTEAELKARRERERTELINRRLQEKYGDAIPPLAIPPLPNAEKPVEPPEEEVTEEALAEQMERVEEAAEADAATFPVVPSDAGADPAEAGATEADGDAGGVDQEAEPPSIESLVARIAALEAWKESAEVRLTDLMG